MSMRGLRSGLLALLLGAALMAGCGGSRGPEGASDTSAGAERASVDVGDDTEAAADPCTVLAAKEVEALIGPLVGPPHRESSSGIAADGSRCVFEARDLRSLWIDVTWSDGAAILNMLGKPAAMAADAGLQGKLALADGVTIDGDWDEARAIGCCQVDALLGDQLIAIDFGNTKLGPEQAATLLDQALKRLDAPLKNVHGSDGNEAAKRRRESREGRPKAVPACDLVTADDATRLLGPVEKLPADDDRHCQYRGTQKIGLIDFSVAWDGGYRSFREGAANAATVMSGLLGGLAKDPGDAKPQEHAGPWEEADAAMLAFRAVRKDVLMSVDTRGTSTDNARTIVCPMNWRFSTSAIEISSHSPARVSAILRSSTRTSRPNGIGRVREVSSTSGSWACRAVIGMLLPGARRRWRGWARGPARGRRAVPRW